MCCPTSLANQWMSEFSQNDRQSSCFSPIILFQNAESINSNGPSDSNVTRLWNIKCGNKHLALGESRKVFKYGLLCRQAKLPVWPRAMSQVTGVLISQHQVKADRMYQYTHSWNRESGWWRLLGQIMVDVKSSYMTSQSCYQASTNVSSAFLPLVQFNEFSDWGHFFMTPQTHLEYKRLIEDRIQRFLVDFGVKLLLLVREEHNFDVRIWGSTWIHRYEVCRLKDADCELQQGSTGGRGVGTVRRALHKLKIQHLLDYLCQCHCRRIEERRQVM